METNAHDIEELNTSNPGKIIKENNYGTHIVNVGYRIQYNISGNGFSIIKNIDIRL